MDANGIDLQVISHVAPAAQGLPGAEGLARAREANDLLAAAVRAHPASMNTWSGCHSLICADTRSTTSMLSRPCSTIGSSANSPLPAHDHGFVVAKARHHDDGSLKPISFESYAEFQKRLASR